MGMEFLLERLNILTLIVVMIAQLCEYTKATEVCTLSA